MPMSIATLLFRKVTMTDPLLTLPPVPPMLPAPKPTRWRTLRTPDGFRPSPRQQQRAARSHAERWYQAVREWQTSTSSELVPRTTRSSGAGRMVAIVGNYGRGQATLTFSKVYTPLGWLSESAVAQAISRAGGLLERVREGKGLSSLIDERGGWHPQKGRALEYARAALALAVELGDTAAGAHLAEIQ